MCIFASSLQKFKLGIANTVIGHDNSSLQSMNTSDLLDLFQVSGSVPQSSKSKVCLCVFLYLSSSSVFAYRMVPWKGVWLKQKALG
jgi:hypothetical protein